MKVLQILPELNVGGVETGTLDLAFYLKEHGHEALVVSNGGKLVDELERAGIKHYQLPVHKKSFWTAFQSVKALKKIIEEIAGWDAIKEKGTGIFYFRSTPFMHFHDKDGERWAHVKNGKKWGVLEIPFDAKQTQQKDFMKIGRASCRERVCQYV